MNDLKHVTMKGGVTLEKLQTITENVRQTTTFLNLSELRQQGRDIETAIRESRDTSVILPPQFHDIGEDEREWLKFRDNVSKYIEGLPPKPDFVFGELDEPFRVNGINAKEGEPSAKEASPSKKGWDWKSSESDEKSTASFRYQH